MIERLEFSSGLNPASRERLALLLEEMGEAQQIIGKILRHGFESYSPFDSEKITNRCLLEKELAHVSVAMGMLFKADDIDWLRMLERKREKEASLVPYLHYQEGQ